MDTLAARRRDQTGVAIDVLPADLTATDDRSRVEARLREDSRIGLLVNNAGAALLGGFTAAELDVLQRLIDLNSTSVVQLAGAVVPRFLAEGDGAIINIASVLALAPEVTPGIYPATKVVVLTFLQSLQVELSGRFDRREAVTIPPLPDAAEWEMFSNARKAMLPVFRQEHPPPRRSPVAERRAFHLAAISVRFVGARPVAKDKAAKHSRDQGLHWYPHDVRVRGRPGSPTHERVRHRHPGLE